MKSSSNIQQQAQQQTLQPGLPASTGVNTSPGTLSRSKFHWSHTLIAVGLLAASGAGTVIVIKVFAANLSGWCYLNLYLNGGEYISRFDISFFICT